MLAATSPGYGARTTRRRAAAGVPGAPLNIYNGCALKGECGGMTSTTTTRKKRGIFVRDEENTKGSFFNIS